jgi:hypothetical protein
MVFSVNAPLSAPLFTPTINAGTVNSSVVNVQSIVIQDSTEPAAAVPAVDLYSRVNIPEYQLGTKYQFNGRTYRYCLIRSNPSIGGLEFQSRNLAASETNIHISAEMTAQTTGGRTLTITAPATITANQYANYMLYRQDGDWGQDVLVVSHPAANIGESVVLTVNTNLFSVSLPMTVNLVQSPYIIAPYGPAANQVPIGANLQDIYGVTGYVWVQSGGLTSLKQSTDGGPNLIAPGYAVVPAPGGNAWVMKPNSATGPQLELPQIGIGVVAPTGISQMALVNLTID